MRRVLHYFHIKTVNQATVKEELSIFGDKRKIENNDLGHLWWK